MVKVAYTDTDNQKQHITCGCLFKGMGKECHKTKSHIRRKDSDTEIISLYFYDTVELVSDDDEYGRKKRKTDYSLLQEYLYVPILWEKSMSSGDS